MLDVVVNLYRKLDRPTIDGDVFEYSGEIDESISTLIEEAEALPEGFGRIEIQSRNESFVDFEFFLPSGGEAAFCQSFDDLIERFPSVSKGVLPCNFYIVGEDWAPFDDEVSDRYERLKGICSLIQCLSSLAISVDATSSPYYNNLFFAVSSTDSGKPKTFVLKTKVSVDMLEVDVRHIKVLKTLVDEQYEGKLHIEERKMIFKSSLGDVLSLESVGSDSFLYLIENWDDMIHSYWKSLQAYVYGFSFDKIRTEIANSEIEYCTKLSSSLSEIAGKLLALPLSLAALPILAKTESVFDFIAISLGLFIVTTVVLCMVVNQRFVVSRLKSSFDTMFEQFKVKLNGYPKSLRDLLGNTLSVVHEQCKLLNNIFFIFSLMSVVPMLGVLYLSEKKYSLLSVVYALLHSSLSSLISFIPNFS